MNLELLESLAKHLPSLTDPQKAAAGELIRLLAGGAPTPMHASYDEPPASPGIGSSHDRPNPDFVAKGRRLLPNWKDRVLEALETPMTRDELCDALREAHKGCPPPFAVSYLLHNLWSHNLVKLEAGPSVRGRSKPLWCCVEAASETIASSTPKAAKKRAALNTEQAVTDWMWEYLGSFPHYRCNRPEAIAALLAAGAPEQLESMRLTKSVGNTFGQDKVDFLYIKDHERGNDQNWLMRVVDEDGQPIKRDHSGNIIS